MKEPLSASGVQKLLTAPWQVFYADELPSTNRTVKEWGDQGRPAGSVLIAGRQSQGRGRLGRSFHSPGDTGLYLSVLLRPDCSPEEASFFTVRMAVAACRACESLGIFPEIKWVNDLYLRGRKVCGILAESALTSRGDGVEYAVCGIGFNVYPPKGGFPGEIAQIAGALLEEPGETDLRTPLAGAFLNEFYTALSTPRERILEEYRRRSFLIGRQVYSPAGAFEGPGEVLGIDGDGGLMLRLSDGTLRTLTCGEVSVRICDGKEQ